MLLCLILGHSIPVPKIRGSFKISCSKGNVFDAEWPYVISNWYLSKQVSLSDVMINTVLKLSFVFVRSFGQFLVWFSWSDFCCFDLVVQLNNISSINGHYYNRIKHLFFMYGYTGGQVSSCYIPLWDTDFVRNLGDYVLRGEREHGPRGSGKSTLHDKTCISPP